MDVMRVVKGKVVGNVVILEEPLPEGAEVEVAALEPGEDEFFISEEMHRELDDAEAELARGEGIDFDEFWVRLPPA